MKISITLLVLALIGCNTEQDTGFIASAMWQRHNPSGTVRVIGTYECTKTSKHDSMIQSRECENDLSYASAAKGHEHDYWCTHYAGDAAKKMCQNDKPRRLSVPAKKYRDAVGKLCTLLALLDHCKISDCAIDHDVNEKSARCICDEYHGIALDDD